MDKLIKEYFEKEPSSDERLEVLRKTSADEAFREEFIFYHNLHTLLQLTPQGADADEGIKGFKTFLSLKKKREARKLVFNIIRYAAIIALLITGTWYGSFIYNNHQISEKQNKLYVPAGQRACLTLNDGTEVWLNAGSTLIYPAEFKGKERLVTLNGEAFFDVASDREKPFIVSVKSVHVKALGTVFNIYGYADEDHACVSLLEGSVQVYQSGDPDKDIILKPFEQAFIRNGEMRIEPINNMVDFLWKDGIYSFNDEPFERIIKKLEQYYCVKIVVKNPSILDFEYTGKFFQLDGVDEILRIIQKIQLFKIEKDIENNIIYIDR